MIIWLFCLKASIILSPWSWWFLYIHHQWTPNALQANKSHGYIQTPQFKRRDIEIMEKHSMARILYRVLEILLALWLVCFTGVRWSYSYPEQSLISPLPLGEYSTALLIYNSAAKPFLIITGIQSTCYYIKVTSTLPNIAETEMLL